MEELNCFINPQIEVDRLNATVLLALNMQITDGGNGLDYDVIIGDGMEVGTPVNMELSQEAFEARWT